MKYLEDAALTALAQELSEAELGFPSGGAAGGGGARRVLSGRIEAYTTKRARHDKRYAAALGESFVRQIETQENELAAAAQRRPPDLPPRRVCGRKRSQSAGVFEESMSSPASARRCLSEGNENGHEKRRAVDVVRRSRSRSFDVAAGATEQGCAPPRASMLFSLSPLGDFKDMGTRRLMTDLILTLNASFPDYDFSSAHASDFGKCSVVQAILSVQERLSEFACRPSAAGDHHSSSSGRAGPALSADTIGGAGKTSSHFFGRLWASVNKVVPLAGCDVYTYRPLAESAGGAVPDDGPLLSLPMAGAAVAEEAEATPSSPAAPPPRTVLWSFNYFFVNRASKRIVFFACAETMESNDSLDEDDGAFYEDDHVVLIDEGDYYDEDNNANADNVHGNTRFVVAADDRDSDDSMEDDFDLDPASFSAGGIPVSIA